jgi:hypothetical protein
MLCNRAMRHQRKDAYDPVFINSTVFTTYPDCSMNCLENNVRKSTCAAFDDDSKLYSDCVCRRSDAFQLAAAGYISKGCRDELYSSARNFSDSCASSGGSTISYDTWLAQESGINGVRVIALDLTVHLLTWF